MAKIIIIVGFFLLGISSFPNKTRFNKNIKIKKQNQAQAFYNASQTGDKSTLSRENITNLKRLGLIHLLTPSGIHLSSILCLFLFLLSKKQKFFLFSLLIITSLYFPNLYSLKRVLYFHLFYLIPNSKLNKLYFSFICTFLLDLIIGGYTASPLSYCFSFIFWGVIIFSKGSYERVILLFIAQLVTILVLGKGKINLLAIFMNPILTFIYSSLFPIFSLNFWILKFSFLNNLILGFHDIFLKATSLFNNSFSSLTIEPKFLFVIVISSFIYRSKTLVLFILLTPTYIHTKVNVKGVLQKEFLPLYQQSEIVKVSPKKVIFFESKCMKKYNGVFFELRCKKKPSKYGGPNI